MISGADDKSDSRLPEWEIADLPDPEPLSWRNWKSFVGPGVVMMGIQIGGGEWLFGPQVTARYGGGLMWIATIAIVLQVFYNLECGRYALYCGEPVLTGFMRLSPGPRFWIGAILLMNVGALIPGLSTHGAAILASIFLDRPPGVEDRRLVLILAHVCLIGVAAPVLVGGKVYNMLQAVMTIKVLYVLGFCFTIGVLFVSSEHWLNVFGGFVNFAGVPVADGRGGERVVNAALYYRDHGVWPTISLANIAVLGAFAGYAGGGGLANSTYSNFVRDKGWGMGRRVGAIASAIGGKNITLSHVGKRFPITDDNMRRWRGWRRYVLADQAFIWTAGCFMGMALPALLSLEFARYSTLQGIASKLDWAQALITADGLRHAPRFGAVVSRILWGSALVAGLAVMLPSQMSIVDDFSRRWTDAIWTANARVRRTFQPDQVKWIYYGILTAYIIWSFLFVNLFSTPKLMTIVIANLNNVAIGVTSFLLIRVNHRLLPPELRPGPIATIGVLCCGAFYLGLAGLVFYSQVVPLIVHSP